MDATLHSSSIEGAARRLVFSFAHEGRTWGPLVEDRPIAEDAEAFIAERQAALEAELNQPDPYALMQAALDTHVAPGTYDALRRALRDIGGEMVELGPMQLAVTYPTVTNPEDAEAALRARVDGEIGAGALDGVKAVLRGMGIEAATVKRSSTITL